MIDSLGFGAKDFKQIWQGNATGRQVCAISCDDDEQEGIEDVSFLEHFPHLEQLDVQGICFHREKPIDPFPNLVPINLSMCPHLRSLTELRVRYQGLAPSMTAEVTIPAHLHLQQTLILGAERLHLRLESPQKTASNLKEMIIGSIAPDSHFTGVGLFELMDALVGRGIAVGTAVACGDDFAYKGKRMCLYTRRQGECARSYQEVVEGLRGCSCRKCWTCLYENM